MGCSAGATAILLGYQKYVMDVELLARYIESQNRVRQILKKLWILW
jgi:hypothetical protein